MAKRVLGLIGAGEGPWVDVSQLKNPHARVTGMDEGEIEVHANDEPKNELSTRVGVIGANGVHPLQPRRFMRVVARNCRLATVCTFVSR